MSTLPAGTVTFLFTDIEGSTRLWQQHPETMKAALARHHDLLQRAIESSGGYVFQIIGDAFCAAFHTALAGVDAAVAAQGALTREQWGEADPIRVRMALHTGAAEIQAGEHKSGEYVSGLTLSHTARLLSVAYGGQILVSNATRQLISDELLSRVELRDLGRHQLRDLPRAQQIFQVVAPNLPEVFPALKSLEAISSNLPRQLTSFIGREAEMGEVKRLLAGTHLLTLTGPGGSGKTRLSLEIGAALFDDHPDGVWLLEFAPVTDPVLVPQVLAATLGVREEAARPLSLTLVDYLRPKRALLLFDNCEHLIDACARLAETLLRACADVKVLASSREPLALTGEVVFHVPPLSLPDPRQSPALGHLREHEAIRLFVDRAAAAKPAFTLTETNAGAVAQICRQLDAIPLAIELAAARVRALSVQQITANLDERFHLLIGGNRTTLPRHQTLRGSIDWSYGLLSEAESALFRRLSVFVGGWTLGAAEAVCAGDGVDRYDVVTLLGRLVDKSLVVMDDETGDARYQLLETIRQYSLEKLTETPAGEVVRDRHRNFYLALAEDAEQQLLGPDQVAWLERLEADHDNLRAALRWSLDRRDSEPALRLGGALWPFWDTHGYVGRAASGWTSSSRRPASSRLPLSRRRAGAPSRRCSTVWLACERGGVSSQRRWRSRTRHWRFGVSWAIRVEPRKRSTTLPSRCATSATAREPGTWWRRASHCSAIIGQAWNRPRAQQSGGDPRRGR
jgi:predicted ATPase/class 3 adenylate cyclase